ncbi:MAG: hypothetical protein U1E60_19020 [Reyranellaceae bacterium]
MAACQSTPSVGAASQSEDLRTLIETDRRRGRIGLHVTSDMTRPAYMGASLWLAPDAAERLAGEILQAVQSWRADQAVTAWTAQTGGRHG